jgi:hypothetical protein
MKLNKQQTKQLYAWCLAEGLSIEYGKLSLCDLSNYRHSMVFNERRYQVHCDDPNCPWSMIYDKVGPAIEKFMELKKKARRVK